jgi:hydroxylamine reductase
MNMFCNQCEQTAKDGCTTIGVCGKKHEVAALQDLLTYAVRGLSHLTVSARSAGINDAEINRFSMKAIFSTLTNVNFDLTRLETLVREMAEKREKLKTGYPAVVATSYLMIPPPLFSPRKTLPDW